VQDYKQLTASSECNQIKEKLRFLQCDLTMPRGRDPVKVQYILMLQWSATRPPSPYLAKVWDLLTGSMSGIDASTKRKSLWKILFGFTKPNYCKLISN
ncbi:hypothetical protein MKW98_021110, partial [Papaver atlanticum]